MGKDVPLDQAIRDLTANIPKSEGGSRPGGAEGEAWYPLTNPNGETAVVYYSFANDMPRHDYREMITHTVNTPDGKTKEEKFPKATKVGRLDSAHRKIGRQGLGIVEGIADVVFVEVGKYHPDYPEAEKMRPEDADVCFFAGEHLDGDTANGYAQGMEVRGGPREVVLNMKNPRFLRTFLHELSHAVAGISHPDNRTRHPRYSNGSTAMGGGMYPLYDDTDFGPYDGATWQHLFGKSKKPVVWQTIVTVEDLKNNPLLYREGEPVTADLSQWDITGEKVRLRAELAREFGAQMYVTRKDDIGEGMTLNSALVPGNRFRDIIGAPNDDKAPEIYATGNELVNILQGGGRHDILTARNGNDILYGGNSGDEFRFDSQSGKRNRVRGTDNVIIDMDPEDKIEFILEDLKQVRLRWRENVEFGDDMKGILPKKYNGTEVYALDSKGNIVSSVFVMEQRPETLKVQITQADRVGLFTSVPLGEKVPDIVVDEPSEKPRGSRRRRDITVEHHEDAVDSGLPSGLKGALAMVLKKGTNLIS